MDMVCHWKKFRLNLLWSVSHWGNRYNQILVGTMGASVVLILLALKENEGANFTQPRTDVPDPPDLQSRSAHRSLMALPCSIQRVAHPQVPVVLGLCPVPSDIGSVQVHGDKPRLQEAEQAGLPPQVLEVEDLCGHCDYFLLPSRFVSDPF